MHQAGADQARVEASDTAPLEPEKARNALGGWRIEPQTSPLGDSPDNHDDQGLERDHPKRQPK
jgi:hypothetical protein